MGVYVRNLSDKSSNNVRLRLNIVYRVPCLNGIVFGLILSTSVQAQTDLHSQPFVQTELQQELQRESIGQNIVERKFGSIAKRELIKHPFHSAIIDGALSDAEQFFYAVAVSVN